MYWQDILGKALIVLGVIFLVGAYNTAWLYILIPVVVFIVAIAFVLYSWESHDILLKSAGIVVGIVIFIFVMFMFSGLGLLFNLFSVGFIFGEIGKLEGIINANQILFAILGIALIVAGFIVRRLRIRHFHGRERFYFR